MNVDLYKNSAPPNRIDKSSSLKNKTIFEDVRFIENGALDILNPSVLMKISNDIADIAKYNYMYIPKFSRYYYIDKISTEGELIRIDGRVDVLMSHKKDILASKQYVIRSQSRNPSPYLEDNMLPIKSTHNYTSVPFGIDVDNIHNGRIILATAGEGGTPV